MREVPHDPDPIRVHDWSSAAQMPGESAERHRWLRLYLSMSPDDRHLADVARIVNVSYSAVRKASSTWRWKDRAAAWDHEQRQLQGTVLRETATIGLTRLGNASNTHASSLENYAKTPEAMHDPAKTASALKSTVAALREVADFGMELEAAQAPDLELRELAASDPHAAAARALAMILTAAGGRTSDKIAAARALESMPIPDGLGVDQVFALLATVQGKVSSSAAAELSAAIAEEAAV